MIFDVIIIGAGASGLMCASQIDKNKKFLILEKGNKAGRKLLMSGAGQCNLTQGGSIKDFINHYGGAGRKIRTALYGFSNVALKSFFEAKGLPMFTRADGKVFPKSLSSLDVKKVFIEEISKKGHEIKYNYDVKTIHKDKENYIINEEYICKTLVVASGGVSYPITGSDGKLFHVLKEMNINIEELRPSLVPIYVENYHYGALSGISFQNISMTVHKDNKKKITETGDLLLTYKGFSGPLVLNLSRYMRAGQKITIDFIGRDLENLDFQGIHRSIENQLSESTGLPKKFIKCHLDGYKVSGRKSSSFSKGELEKIIHSLRKSKFVVSGTEGYAKAMATAGGVSLEEMDLKTFQLKKHLGLFVIGEALDVDGDTGGYNLQFAFSSGFLSGHFINEL